MSDFCFKILTIGELNVGKTAISDRFCSDTFYGNDRPVLGSIGAIYFTKKLRIDEKTIELQFWDTSGMERFGSFSPLWYRGASLCYICYDITNRKSYDKVEYWINEVKMNNKNCLLYLVGTKCDLEDKREVSPEEEELAEHFKIPFIETSSKDDININELFDNTISMVMQKKQEEQKEEPKESVSESENTQSCYIY